MFLVTCIKPRHFENCLGLVGNQGRGQPFKLSFRRSFYRTFFSVWVLKWEVLKPNCNHTISTKIPRWYKVNSTDKILWKQRKACLSIFLPHIFSLTQMSAMSIKNTVIKSVPNHLAMNHNTTHLKLFPLSINSLNSHQKLMNTLIIRLTTGKNQEN